MPATTVTEVPPTSLAPTCARGHVLVALAVLQVARRLKPRHAHALAAGEPAAGLEALFSSHATLRDIAKVRARVTDLFDAGAVADGFLHVLFQGWLRVRFTWLSVEVHNGASQQHFGTVG